MEIVRPRRRPTTNVRNTCLLNEEVSFYSPNASLRLYSDNVIETLFLPSPRYSRHSKEPNLAAPKVILRRGSVSASRILPIEQASLYCPSLGGKVVRKGVGTDGETNENANGLANDHANVHANGRCKAPFPREWNPNLAEPGNPKRCPCRNLPVIPLYTFLVRHPRSSISSPYRCVIPLLGKVSSFHNNYMPSKTRYDELRRMFDFS